MRECCKNVVRVAASGVLVGSACYAIYKVVKYYQSKDSDDEGFIEGKQSQVSFDKKVLVIGLNGSGKTSVISRIAHLNTGMEPAEATETKPTEGFSVTSVNKRDMTLNIWEIGGGEKIRPFWSNFLLDVDVLVFVVDSSDNARMSLAYEELHKVIGDDRTKHTPVLVIANKQDVVGAEDANKIKHLLGLEGIPKREHAIQVVATQIYPYNQGDMSHDSIRKVEECLIRLCNL